MISDNILAFVNKNKDKTFILKNDGHEGHIICFKNSSIIIEWETMNGEAILTEEYSIENLEKYTEIKKPIEVGNIVKIVNDGELFEYYDSWFERYNIPYEYALHYRWGCDLDKNDFASCFKVIAINKHLAFKKNNVYLIQRTDGKTVYLIGEKGIEKC